MNEALVPEWMKKIRREDELAEAKKESARKLEVGASPLLQQEGPKFWHQLQQSLATVVDSLPVLKLSGSISRFSEGIRIEVVYYYLIPVQTYMDIYYDPDTAVIRCATMSGGICQLYLCAASNNEIAAFAEFDGPPMDPEQTSEYLMRPMVDSVRVQK
ncbi:MAG: hypothetical protein JXR49_18610 [Acidobacteria bacterium]|nr:hypothetical protein [Acidobacteriota bacterium]